MRSGRFDAVTLVIQLSVASTSVNFGNPESVNEARLLSRTDTELKFSSVPSVNEVNLFELTIRLASDVRADTSKEVRRLLERVRLLRSGRFDAVTPVIQLFVASTSVNFGNPESVNDVRRF